MSEVTYRIITDGEEVASFEDEVASDKAWAQVQADHAFKDNARYEAVTVRVIESC